MANPPDPPKLPLGGGVFVPHLLIDSALFLIQTKIVEEGYDQIQLPPWEHEISEKRLGVHWTGTLVLTHGKFIGLHTIHRLGDPVISFNGGHHNGEIKFKLDLSFTKPSFTHDFNLVFMNTTDKDGTFSGTASSVTFATVIALNILSGKMRLVELKCKDIGDITSDISGLGVILDWFVSKLSKTILNRTKWEIATEVETRLKHILSEIIDNHPWPVPEIPGVFNGMKDMFGDHH